MISKYILFSHICTATNCDIDRAKILFQKAQARCHRIGQEKAVKVYRLITKGTYERHMFERASLKLGLDQAVLGKIAEGRGLLQPTLA